MGRNEKIPSKPRAKNRGYEAASGKIGPVVELFDLGFDALAGEFADVGVLTQRLGDGDQRDAQRLGDVFHLYCHGGTIHFRSELQGGRNGILVRVDGM